MKLVSSLVLATSDCDAGGFWEAQPSVLNSRWLCLRQPSTSRHPSGFHEALPVARSPSVPTSDGQG
ncbi:hypothetical protein IscW_ISCW015397 [Ixodes scapularis]|uniref:Uncharacterized protein n=1 Tax=Ixodes scapularis TaxID=6945 RepID=B7QNE8_IXOSC|nr:hypothetical protein IscW_ISCW015397 [Ixodes scapularis]|eukprot:XP_002416453.1 hypothetical protein IscW_ISCW015397 [Ixodes scapularis]